MAKPSSPGTKVEVVVVNAGGEISPQIQQGLREKRYATRIIQGFANLKTALQNLNDPVLLVEAGPNPSSVEKCVKMLAQISSELQHPVILIGDGADQYERELDTLFPATTTLNIPYGTVEILAALNYITRSYIERKKKAPKPAAPHPSRAKHLAGKSEAHGLYESTKSIPDLVFGQLGELDLFGKTLGGALFSSNNLDAAFLAHNKMLPHEPEVREAIEQLCTDAGKWGRLHLARTSYMAQKIVEAMNPDASMREHLKSAGFLYAWAFAGTNPQILQQPYLDGRSATTRKQLSQGIKESAESVSREFELEQVRVLISMLARLIGKEQIVTDDDVAIAASAIMASDITSRICFIGGSWNPRRAYDFLSRLKNGDVQEFHPAILCCTVKFLAEGIAGRTPLHLLKRELRENKEFLESLIEEARRPVAKGETRIPLSSLVPGMKLSKPLKALDGREILSTDLVLDEDLIWRIWQLSAIRPLKAPIIRKNQGEK